MRHLIALGRSLRIQHQKQPVLQLVNSLHHFSRHTAQRFRRRLECGFVDFDHVADLVVPFRRDVYQAVARSFAAFVR